MKTEVSYSEARANFAKLWDQVVSEREPLIIHRRGKEDVALLPADELTGIIETAHLLRSPRNAERLLTALARAREGQGEATTVGQLKQDLDLG